MIVITPDDPLADKRSWVFLSVQSADLMVQRMVERKAATIGLSVLLTHGARYCGKTSRNQPSQFADRRE